MKKQFTKFLILVLLLGLVPINISQAITQNQIDAEVQIVCTDGTNWLSGSGTIIDPKGIILTNRHVVEGAYKNTCFIGFIESINKEPNFGTSGNYNLAEVKYQTTTDDMDAAILYLDNPANKTYPYVDIWGSNSDALKFGDKVEVVGFPSIGGSTITYTSGDFSGFGSSSDGTQNYIKTTAPLEHGNSGGGAYNSSGQFIGIPTIVVAGALNSMSYVLSVNSIKGWLNGVLGSGYKKEVIEQEPIVVKPTVDIQNDITPPNINVLEGVFYELYDKDMNKAGQSYSTKDSYKSAKYSNVKFSLPTFNYYNENYFDLMENGSGVNIVYYNYSKNLSSAVNNLGKKLLIANWHNVNSIDVTDIIQLQEEGTYYISLKFEDNVGNISNSFVVPFIYEKEHFREIKKMKFYKDSNYQNIIGDYGYNSNITGDNFKYCVTKHKEIGIEWEYYQSYAEYIADSFRADMWALKASDKDSKIFDTIKDGRYFIKNLDSSKNENYATICESTSDTKCNTIGKLTSFLLKPILSENDLFLEGTNILIKLVYNPDVSYDLLCGDADRSRSNNGMPYYVLKEGNILKFDNDSQTVNIGLNGLILLQVEQNGEAYYIYPDDSKKYYLGRPKDAFDVMRKLGLGATHKFITTHTIYPDHVLGKILLDVEDSGKAYYIYPKDKKAYYLGRPADAFKVMRELGLGITNSDLSKIPEGSL